MYKKVQVSIVEDNVFYSNLLDWHLSQNDLCTIKTYHTAESFLKTNVADHDIVILDYYLKSEHITGLDIALMIADTPKIFLSNLNDKIKVEKLTNLSNIHNYFKKGYHSIGDVKSSVDKLIEDCLYH